MALSVAMRKIIPGGTGFTRQGLDSNLVSVTRLIALRKGIRVWLSAVLLSAHSLAWAHDPGLSSATLRLHADELEGQLIFSVTDVSTMLDLTTDAKGNVSAEQREAAALKLETLAPGALEVSFDGERAKAAVAQCSFDGSNNASIFLSFPARLCTNLVVRSKWMGVMPEGHRQLLSLQGADGQPLAERLLSANSDSITLQLAPAAEKPLAASKSNSFADFLVLGVRHIWTGYDHLLFLLGLLIVTRNFVSSLKIITCFTLAHSITLAVATLSLVHLSSKVVEPLIAASIVYVGVENLLRGDDAKGRWLLAFGFGLIHGFGFASVLRDLGVGSNGSGITVPLVSFNLGVEVGQIAIAALVLPVIWKLRAWPVYLRVWVPACSGIVVLLGAWWFVQRVWL